MDVTLTHVYMYVILRTRGARGTANVSTTKAAQPLGQGQLVPKLQLNRSVEVEQASFPGQLFNHQRKTDCLYVSTFRYPKVK